MRRSRQDYRRAGSVPLVVLTGFPHPISGAVAKAVETRFSPKVRVVHAPCGTDGRKLYRAQTLTSLMRAVSEYADRQLKIESRPPSPKHILLAYVPAEDEESLLEAFEFVVFPVRLSRLAQYNDHGRQLRHDLDQVVPYVLSSLDTATHAFNLGIHRRLSTVNDKEPLFLPPENFRLSETEPVREVFRRMLRQQVSWSDPITGLKRASHRGTKTVFSDVRGLLFPHDPAFHGRTRDAALGSSDEERRLFMRSSFRFGVPLMPGYHHDVQFEGRNLGGAKFWCSRQGTLNLNCSHANIYPNDFVRVSAK